MDAAMGSLKDTESVSTFKDCLTGLFNYDFFLIYLEQEFHRRKRYGNNFTLAMVGVDVQEGITTLSGAIENGPILQQAARAIHDNIRNVDIAAPYPVGGFAILFVGADYDHATSIANRIRAAIDNAMQGRFSVSIGLACLSGAPNETPEQMVQEALAARAFAKDYGQNEIVHHQRPLDDVCNTDRPNILLVDDEPLNLKFMEALLTPLWCTIHKAESGSEALLLVEKFEIDLIVLDIMMPVMDGIEACRILKATDDTRMIPVILLTALDDVESKIRGIEAGADDFISKPPNKRELLARIKALLSIKKLNGNLANIENVLFTMAKTVEAKDSYTQGHVDRVSEIALIIGARMGLSNGELDALRIGGALHDIGKMGVPEEILNKPGPLDDREWAIMKTHPEIGYKICLPLKKNLGQALDIVRHHHEKLDGSGYPDQLTSGEIPMVARIMAVADIYDALVTDRPYRKAMSKMKAMEILALEAKQGKLDHDVTRCLIGLFADEDFVSQ
jgi:putative two-component system response regulator